MKSAQFCFWCMATSLKFQLDVDGVVLSTGAPRWLVCFIGLELAHHRLASHSLYVSCWILPFLLCVLTSMLLCPMPPVPLTLPMLPTIATQITSSSVLQCPQIFWEAKLRLAWTCVRAIWPAYTHKWVGRVDTSRLNKCWALSASPRGTDAPLALISLQGQMVWSNI